MLVWLRKHWLALFVLVLVVNGLAGTFAIKFTETQLNWADAVFVHLTSFTTLGSNIPVNTTIARAYVVIDALLGYIVIPTLSALLALRFAAIDFLKSTEKNQIKKGRTPEQARKLAEIQMRAMNIIIDDTLSEEQKKEAQEKLLREAKEAIDQTRPKTAKT